MKNNNLCHMSLVEMSTGLRDKKFSSVELVKEHLRMVEKYNKSLNAYVTVTKDHAMKQASIADQRISDNLGVTPLTGIPIGIKDLFCTIGIKTTACSKMLENFIPNYESTVTQRLFDAGAVMLGKTNMDEFAMGSGNLYSSFGPCINPWKNKNDFSEKMVPGGSSGGSASAVASFMCAASTGSDTGGSVRQPASLCGLVGLKPTYGRCSRWGMVAFASSLDQAGFFARSVQDVSHLFQYSAGYDPRDPTTSDKLVPDLSSINSDIKGKKIGVPFSYFNNKDLSKDVHNVWQKTIEHIKLLGAEIVNIDMESMLEYALPVYYLISSSEASSNLSRYDGIRYGSKSTVKEGESIFTNVRSEYFGKEVKRRISTGTYFLSYCDDHATVSHGNDQYVSYYDKAIVLRNHIKHIFNNIFKDIDLFIMPTSPRDAFSLTEQIDDGTMYLNDCFTVPISLAGLPSVSLPVGLSSRGLPLGMQFVGNSFDEKLILQSAYAVEQTMDGVKLIDNMQSYYN